MSQSQSRQQRIPAFARVRIQFKKDLGYDPAEFSGSVGMSMSDSTPLVRVVLLTEKPVRHFVYQWHEIHEIELEDTLVAIGEA